jgi:hypothetical protein
MYLNFLNFKNHGLSTFGGEFPSEMDGMKAETFTHFSLILIPR